jgi:heme/copper-type cytochrome/quinol oxidase subunit 1
MFSTVRYFLKTGIVFLIIGLLTGLYMSISRNILNTGYGPEFLSAHTHVILSGGVMMIIMGVALWFFPRPEKDDTKYNPDVISISYWIMTLSSGLRFISQVIIGFTEVQPVRILITLFSLGQIIATLIFFYGMWGRIRPSGGSKVREARGEKF